MNDIDPNQLAFSREVKAAWDEILRRHEARVPAEKSGENSISGFIERLYPVRQGFKEVASKYLEQIPVYRTLKIYLAHFWASGRKGAYLKDHIWNFASPDRYKTRGRLQFSLNPAQHVYGEYVAYPKTEAGRTYHIEKISNWLRIDRFFEILRNRLLDLPVGFWFCCTCGDGTEIDAYVHDATESQWQSLHQSGLDLEAYFLIARYNDLADVEALTIDQLAQLWVGDLAEMSRIYPLLQHGATDTVQSETIFPVEEKVYRARDGKREREAEKLLDQDLTEKALRSQESEGITGPGKFYSRDPYVAAFAKRFANGRCDLCGRGAPFTTKAGRPYLESHHIIPRSEGGRDHIENVVAMCPNCHRKIHHWRLDEDIEKLKQVAKSRAEAVTRD